ncbi:hypothetical protein ACHAXT_013026 [Thalassiosira profunda]
MASPTPPPLRPVRLLLRTKDAVLLHALPDTSSTAEAVASKKGGITLYSGKTTFHLLSPDGNSAYVHDATVGLVRFDLTNATGINTAGGVSPFLQNSKSIQLAKCSPRGTRLLTWERPSKADGDGGNLKVWNAKSGELVEGFSCKKATLNTVQWTHDERLVFHMVTNEIHVYDAEFNKVGRVRCPGVASFSLPAVKGYPSDKSGPLVGEEKYLLTTFVPGTKGKPARVDLLRYPDRTGRDSSTVGGDKVNVPSGPSLASKSLFNAEETTVEWSPRADAALLTTQTAVDATGESYYGSSHLFLLAESDAKRPGFGSAISVPLPAEATKTSQGTVPIVAANWIANPNIVGPVPFGVISGRMPALASLHHGVSAEPTFLLGRAHRNTMDVSPHGRFIACGGYGNLAGGMDFWDRNKGKKIARHVVLPGKDGETNFVTIKEGSDLGVTSASPVVGHQWSPDSRTYLVSTTSPRMNVDNGVHLYRYDGSLVDEARLPWDNQDFKPDKLLAAEYVPAPFPNEGGGDGKGEFYYYPDRPQSPAPRRFTELKGDAAKAALATLSSESSKGDGKGGAPAAAAYVPPGARKGGGGAYVPPGARKGSAERGGSSLAERLRQEREGSATAVSGVKIAKRAGPVGAASVVGAAPAAAEKSKSALRREKQRLAREAAEREAAAEEQRKKDEEAARVAANKADPEKRAKKIKKSLKQIDEIKAKAAGGAELNEDQRRKVDSEAELRAELAALGLQTEN